MVDDTNISPYLRRPTRSLAQYLDEITAELFRADDESDRKRLAERVTAVMAELNARRVPR